MMTWGLVAFFAVILGTAVYVVVTVLSEDAPRKRTNVATITLVKPPPPPPPVKEKPPEPEQIKPMKQEQIITPGPQDQPKSDAQDNTPAGDKLGVDAEGKAGSDGFGLIGKKGGRSLLAGGGGDGTGRLSLLGKFAWYTQIVETEIRKKVSQQLDENGGVPRGRLQTVVRVSLDGHGMIVQYRIIGSSGNHKMDEAVKQSLGTIRISEAPPDGMPRTMNIKVTSQS